MKATSVRNCCLAYNELNPDARLRLFCFPYAGGGSVTFRTWSNHLPQQVDVCPVELPGRGTRLGEPLFTQLPPLVEAMGKELLPHLDKPFALFGHSMGALISFELACHLRKEYDLNPVHLFVSAHRAPQVPDPGPPIYSLPERDFLERLYKLNGIPSEVLEEPELMQLMLPILRADMEVSDRYTYSSRPPLNCPISVFGGVQDHSVSRHQLQAWCSQTHASFTERMLPGGHFFLHMSQPLLLGVLAHQLHQTMRNILT